MRKAFQNPDDDGLPVVHDHDGAVARWAALEQNGKPVFTIEQVIQQLTRSGKSWNGIGANPTPNAGLGTITFGFFESSAQVYSSEASQFQPLSTAQRDAVRNAFAIWGELINIHFVEGPAGSADINLGNLVTDEDYFSAYATLPDRKSVV